MGFDITPLVDRAWKFQRGSYASALSSTLPPPCPGTCSGWVGGPKMLLQATWLRIRCGFDRITLHRCLFQAELISAGCFRARRFVVDLPPRTG